MVTQLSDAHQPNKTNKTLVIACGAIAREILAVFDQEGLENFELTCLPAEWHNTPDKIIPGLARKIDAAKDKYARIFVGYADCGTGGQLDSFLDGRNIERLPGAHCYGFFAGLEAFDAIMEEEPGTFFLTDYLARHFNRLIIEGLGLDRHPELRDMYFGNYKRLIYFSQIVDPALENAAEAAAQALGLSYEHRHAGYGDMQTAFATLKSPN